MKFSTVSGSSIAEEPDDDVTVVSVDSCLAVALVMFARHGAALIRHLTCFFAPAHRWAGFLAGIEYPER